MISPESLVPLLSRSEKAMIVGDPLQIEPIRNFLKTFRHSYVHVIFPVIMRYMSGYLP